MRSTMTPCRCPECGEDLCVTCPHGCPNAELGATVDARSRGTRPATAPSAEATPRRVYSRETRPRILEVLRVASTPLTAHEIAGRAGLLENRVSAMLYWLLQARLVQKDIPPGRKQGATYTWHGGAA